MSLELIIPLIAVYLSKYLQNFSAATYFIKKKNKIITDIAHYFYLRLSVSTSDKPHLIDPEHQ